MARMEKQRDKAAKRMERKLNRGLPDADPDAAEPTELGELPDEGERPGLAESPGAASNPEAPPKSEAAPRAEAPPKRDE
jgi:hypothetical protein